MYVLQNGRVWAPQAVVNFDVYRNLLIRIALYWHERTRPYKIMDIDRVFPEMARLFEAKILSKKRYGSAGYPMRSVLIHSLYTSLYTLNRRRGIDAPDHAQAAFRGAECLDAV
jgi:hypothetical protein